jgi:hypothetical protein
MATREFVIHALGKGEICTMKLDENGKRESMTICGMDFDELIEKWLLENPEEPVHQTNHDKEVK